MTAAAAAGHARSGNTRWGRGLLLTAVGVPASLLGTRHNTRVDPDVLLLAFTALLLAAAGMLLRAGTAVQPHDRPHRRARVDRLRRTTA